MSGLTLLIAGGGTGGHLFPGLAVAREFVGRDPENRAVFVGTEQGIEARAVPAAGFPLKTIPSQGIAGKGLGRKIRAAAIIPQSFFAARRIIAENKPDAALGVGGYVSGPVLLAAKLMGVPTAIHEQNAAAGMANRLLGRFVDLVFVNFERASAEFPRARARGKLKVVGNPVRAEIVQVLTGAGRRASDRFRIFVVGGSQGAQGLNNLMVSARAARDPARRGKIALRHQSGKNDRDRIAAEYGKLGLDARVDGFIDDMASAYLDADLIVSRSGAGAVAEIALAGLPAILVPYPFAASDHQAVNAEALVAAGAALMFREAETDGAKMADAIARLMDDAKARADMAARALSAAHPRAAAEVVDSLLSLAGKRGA